MGYEFTARVRYSESDEHEQLSLGHALDYFQDCTIFHSDYAGLPLEYWRERNAFWVITSWKILLKRRPDLLEDIIVRTDATLLRAFRGLRNFTIRSAGGELLIAADSSFALLNLATGVPMKILPEEIEAYGIAEPLPITADRSRIEIPEISGEPIEVQHFHMDPNHHMNNAHYLQFAMSFLPEGFEPRTVRIAYHKAALAGDLLYPAFVTDEHGMHGALVDKEGEAYALFSFSDVISEEDAAVFAS